MRALVIAILVLMAVTPGIAAVATNPPGPEPAAPLSADIPSWLVGDSWTYATHVVTRNNTDWTDALGNVTFTVSQRFEAFDAGAFLYLYNSTTTGNFTARGSITDPNLGIAIPFTISSAALGGYAWNERGDQALVKTNQTVTGTGTARTPLGTFPLAVESAMTLTNRPPEEDFDFPIELQDAWRVTGTAHTSGFAKFTLSVPGPDLVIVQPLSGDTTLDVRSWANRTESISVPAGSFETFHVHSVTGGSSTADRWYSPNASNYVRFETHDVSGPARYTHTWTNLTAFAPEVRPVSVPVVLVPRKVGPGGPFQILANTTAPKTPQRVIIPANNNTTTGFTDGTGAFRIAASAPADDDNTPANTDIGSHGVLVELASITSSAGGAASITLLRPDLAVTGFTVSPVPVAEGVAASLTTTISVTTDVPVYSPVNVTFVAEDVDLDRDGIMDSPIDVYCTRSACMNATVAPVLPGNPVAAAVTWTPSPPSLPMDVRVSAVVDPRDRYGETNESNNVVVATVRVEGPNLTPSSVAVEIDGVRNLFDNPGSLGFVSPLITLRAGTIANLTVRVKNTGVVNVSKSTTVAFYNTTALNGTGDPPFGQLTVGPLASGAETGLAAVPWTAPVASGTFFVNVTADYLQAVRETSESDNTFVVRFRVYDPASAADLVPVDVSIPPKASVNRTVWIAARVSNLGATNASGFQVAFYNATQRSTPFAVVTLGPLRSAETSSVVLAPWSSAALGPHEVWVEADYLDDVPEANETNNTVSGTVTVYDIPVTSLTIGSPRVVANTTYIRPTTPLTFSALDRTGAGPPAIWYRVDSGPWTSIAAGAVLTLSAGPHMISYNSTDALGGTEPARIATLFVDDLPPETTPTVSNGTGGKLVSFTAVDLAVGVDWTEYRVDGGPWIRYNGTLVLISGPGNRTVEFRSADLLGNLEPTGAIVVTVGGGAVIPAAALNVKPLLALLFAAILVLAGWFAAPSPDPPRRRRWLLTVVIPPAALELATGAISFGIAEMAVPGGPLGLPVDAALLGIGLLITLFSRRRALRSP